MTPRFVVMCGVSGGVTGSRVAPLKGQDGAIRMFDSHDEAEAEAARLRARAEADRWSTAFYRYWVEEE